MSEPAPAAPARLTVRGAVVLGIGAMVGAGIFALLGQAGAVAGSAVWISFLLAGAMSATLGYTLVKFAMRWPSSGGLIVYLEHGFRSRRLVGVAAWLGYLTAIVVVGAMVAASFGDYAAVPGTGRSHDDAGPMTRRVPDDAGGRHDAGVVTSALAPREASVSPSTLLTCGTIVLRADGDTGGSTRGGRRCPSPCPRRTRT